MSTSQNDNDILIGKLRDGDEKSIKEIYRQNFHYCTSFIMKNKGNMEDARNIFQDTLITFFKKIQDENFVLQTNLKFYLSGIARNLWLKQLNKNKKSGLQLVIDDKESGYILEDKADELEEKIEKDEQLTKMEKALEAHSEECKRILKLFYYEKKTSYEIGAILGYKDGYVRKKKAKCISGLRTKMLTI